MLKVDGKKLQDEICPRDLSVEDFAKSRIDTVGKIALALGKDFTELIDGEPPQERLM